MRSFAVILAVAGTFAAFAAESEIPEAVAEKTQARAFTVNVHQKWTRNLLGDDYGRYVGWPTLTRLRSGELVSVFSGDREGHVCPYGKVMLIRSTDGGETWSKPTVICDGPIDDRDAGLLELANGNLVLFWFTSLAFIEYRDYYEKHPEYLEIGKKIPDDLKRQSLGSWARRSTDGGKTWSEPVRVPVMTPHGGRQLRDGRILVVGLHNSQVAGILSTDRPQAPKHFGVAESTDGGRSFHEIGRINHDGIKSHWSFAEPSFVEAPDGTLTAYFRYELGPDGTWSNKKTYPRFMFRSMSKDGGHTWTNMERAELDGFPPHFLDLGGGRVLCSYGSRTPGRTGIYAAFSADGGKTFDAATERCIYRTPFEDCGYPSTAKLDDGSYLTVFYAYPRRGVPAALTGVKWSDRAQEVNVRSFGAKGDGTTLDTAAIQKALDTGADRVIVPPGTYLTGTLWLKSNTDLHLEKGATLLGSPDLNHYNALDAYPQNGGSKSEGWCGKHLLLAVGQENVSLTGDGTIDGNGRAFFAPISEARQPGDFVWRHGFVSSKDRANQRRPGQGVVFVQCRNVRVSGVRLVDMPCWSCFLHGCEDVYVSGLTVRNDIRHANTDGLDIDTCRHVRVGACDISTGDDVFAIRCNPTKLTNGATTCEDIVISNCIGACAASGVRIGVGNGTIQNVRFSNIRLDEAGHGLLVQTCYPGANHTGATIRDITFENMTIGDSGHAVLVTAGTPAAKAPLENIVFRNLKAATSGSVIVEGTESIRPTNIHFDNLDLTLKAPLHPRHEPRDWEVIGQANALSAAIHLEHADAVTFRDVKIVRDPLADLRTKDFERIDLN